MHTAELRELIVDRDEILVAPGSYDALSAGIVESLGFESAYLGGWATGASTAATEPMATMTEMCDRAREITHTIDIPLIVDGNAGFGNPAHTYRAVQEFAKTGIAGMHIEDQVYPKRLHYHAGYHHITDPEEMEQKVESAVAAQDEMDEDIVLIARSDANRGNRREFETIEDAVNRVNRYFDAGAEVGMLFPETPEETEYVADHADGPMMFVLSESRAPYPTTDELDDLGYAAVIYPISASAAAASAIIDRYESLKTTGSTGFDPDEFSEIRERITEIIDLPHFYEIEEAAGNK